MNATQYTITSILNSFRFLQFFFFLQLSSVNFGDDNGAHRSQEVGQGIRSCLILSHKKKETVSAVLSSTPLGLLGGGLPSCTGYTETSDSRALRTVKDAES